MSPDAAFLPPPPPRASLLGVGRFTAAYMLAAGLAALLLRNREFLFYILVMLGLIAAVAAVHRRVALTRATLWGLSAWGLLHMAGGLVPLPVGWPHQGQPVLYSFWLLPERLKYDQVVHAYGFGVTTAVCWQGIARVARAPRPTFGLLVLAGAASLGFGALNEVVEFTTTLLVPETNVGDYHNTGWDLVANLAGVGVAVLWIGLTRREPGR